MQHSIIYVYTYGNRQCLERCKEQSVVLIRESHCNRCNSCINLRQSQQSVSIKISQHHAKQLEGYHDSLLALEMLRVILLNCCVNAEFVNNRPALIVLDPQRLTRILSIQVGVQNLEKHPLLLLSSTQEESR